MPSAGAAISAATAIATTAAAIGVGVRCWFWLVGSATLAARVILRHVRPLPPPLRV